MRVGRSKALSPIPFFPLSAPGPASPPLLPPLDQATAAATRKEPTPLRAPAPGQRRDEATQETATWSRLSPLFHFRPSLILNTPLKRQFRELDGRTDLNSGEAKRPSTCCPLTPIKGNQRLPSTAAPRPNNSPFLSLSFEQSSRAVYITTGELHYSPRQRHSDRTNGCR